MLERLKELIETGDYKEARTLANRLFDEGEQSELYWILNAALYRIEGVDEAEYACISRGLQKNPSNYELYFMLGNFYRESNLDQAYLCYEQAEYYCTNAEDLKLIEAEMRTIMESGMLEVHPVSIVILSYNIKDIMQGCIESIRNTCPKEAYELVVVDNASTDGVAEWLREQKDLVLQCNAENRGFAAGCNQGIEMAAPENDIMLLNNDTIVPENALFWLRMGLYERKTVGAVGPITNYASNNQALAQQYDSIEEYLNLSRQICVPLEHPYENKIWLMGFAMIVKREAVDQVGGLDTRYEWGNYEDDDYGLKLTQAGYELLLCHNSFIYHYGSMNMTKDLEKYGRYMRENYQRFIDKWNFKIQDYASLKMELIQKMEASCKEEITVLDIGCGYGAALARIKYMYPNAKVHGIEENQEAAVWGTYMGDILVGDIERMELPYQLQMFDYIMVSSEKKTTEQMNWILVNMRKYLKPEGTFLTDAVLEDDRNVLLYKSEYLEKIVKYREKGYEYLQEVNQYLSAKNGTSIYAFIQLFQDKKFVQEYVPCLSELAYAHIFACISLEEMQKRNCPRFILNGNSVEELTTVLKKIEFCLWEVEFQCGEDAEQRLYECLERFAITPEAIKTIITIAGIYKKECYFTVAGLFLEHGRKEEAVQILEYGAEEMPKDEELLGTLIQLCKKLGKHKSVQQYEERLSCIKQ